MKNFLTALERMPLLETIQLEYDNRLRRAPDCYKTVILPLVHSVRLLVFPITLDVLEDCMYLVNSFSFPALRSFSLEFRTSLSLDVGLRSFGAALTRKLSVLEPCIDILLFKRGDGTRWYSCVGTRLTGSTPLVLARYLPNSRR